MRHFRHVTAIALLVMTWNFATRAQEPAAAPEKVSLAPAQMEEFLLRAKIVRTRDAGGGITGSRRATLSDGAVTHDAQIQNINQTLALFRPPTGPPEMNFRDSYVYNVAAYRLAMLLDLDNVPMSVVRNVDGKPSAVTWWVDDVLMDERTRLKTEERGPDAERTAMQTYIMRVFDELIANRDRNMGNLLWTKDWKMWMIDHTRSFRLTTDLQRPAALTRIERSFLESVRGLTQGAVARAVGSSLSKFEIQAMLERRDAIVKLFDAKIAERGEARILYTLPRWTVASSQ